MTKINLFITVLLSVFLFASCEKNPDELTITINQTGTLSVKVVDQDKKAVSDVEVFVRYGSMDVTEGSTNIDGVYHTEKLLQGFYTCYTYAVLGKATYVDSKSVQIITGENRQIELDPFSNSGKVSIKIVKRGEYPEYQYIPVKDLNIALLNSSDYNNVNSIDEYIAAAHFIGKSDSNGMVNISNIPANVSYRIAIYDDKKTIYSEGWYDVYVQRDGVYNRTIEIYNYN